MAHAPESVRHRLAEGGKELRLLQYGVGLAAGERIAGQQQQGDAVGRGAPRRRDHVHGPGADGADAGDDLQPVLLLGERHGRQGHILFVFTLQKADMMPALVQCLAHAHHAAVAEHAEHVVDEFIFLTVQLNILLIQELHQRLGHGQANGFHKQDLLF